MAGLASLSREEPIKLIGTLQQQIDDLRKENEELRRKVHRQAAPFSKGKPVEHKKPPGRKAGQGPFVHRSAPLEPATETVVAVKPESCPDCGGELEQQGVEDATTTGLPVPRPVITRYQVPVCRCRQCGKTVRGTARGLAPDQFGATAHRVGAGVMAAAHTLHYAIGIPVRRVPAVLGELTGISLTQSAMTQDAMRRAAGPVGAAYQDLRQQVGNAPVVHTDDTSWRVAGKPAQLMGFETGQATVYQIRDQHRNEEVREIIPADYKGVMVTDRGKSYDAEELAGVTQQKCVAHLLRNIGKVLENKRGSARRFGMKLKGLLKDGLTLWHARGDLDKDEFKSRAEQLDQQMTDHLRNRSLEDDDNQKLLNGIGWHHGRGHILTFLEVEGVEPTNNRAERILRPAVIARKVSHGSKNQRGAEAFAAFASIVQTARKLARQSISQVLMGIFARPAQVPNR